MIWSRISASLSIILYVAVLPDFAVVVILISPCALQTLLMIRHLGQLRLLAVQPLATYLYYESVCAPSPRHTVDGRRTFILGLSLSESNLDVDVLVLFSLFKAETFSFMSLNITGAVRWWHCHIVSQDLQLEMGSLARTRDVAGVQPI
jgi:hypothetical protein